MAARTTARGTKQKPPRGHRPSGPAAIGPMTNVTTRPSSRTATVIGFAGIGRYAYKRGPRSAPGIGRPHRGRCYEASRRAKRFWTERDPKGVRALGIEGTANTVV